MEILLLLATTAEMLTKGYSWSGFKHHNTVDFFAFFLRNTTITIPVVDIWKTSDKAIILQSCILDVLPKHSNIMAGKGLIFLMNALPGVYICLPRKKSAPLFPKGTVKCTNLAP